MRRGTPTLLPRDKGTAGGLVSQPSQNSPPPINLHVFRDALVSGGARYYCSTLTSSLLTEANAGEGIRAADLASALLTTQIANDPEIPLTPEHLLALLYTQVLPDVIPQVKNSAEGVALAHFVASCLLYSPSRPSAAKQSGTKIKDKGPPPPLVETPARAMYQEALHSLSQFLAEVLEAVTRTPSPILIFITAFFSHPAVSRCSLPTSSHLKFASLLRTLGREDLLLNLFDMRSAEEQMAAAKLFAFPLRVDKFSPQAPPLE